ncbi:unnamed protein product [Gadus morhua 'NCC']
MADGYGGGAISTSRSARRSVSRLVAWLRVTESSSAAASRFDTLVSDGGPSVHRNPNLAAPDPRWAGSPPPTTRLSVRVLARGQPLGGLKKTQCDGYDSPSACLSPRQPDILYYEHNVAIATATLPLSPQNTTIATATGPLCLFGRDAMDAEVTRTQPLKAQHHDRRDNQASVSHKRHDRQGNEASARSAIRVL